MLICALHKSSAYLVRGFPLLVLKISSQAEVEYSEEAAFIEIMGLRMRAILNVVCLETARQRAICERPSRSDIPRPFLQLLSLLLYAVATADELR